MNRVLIIGNRGGTNVGESLAFAAESLGLAAEVVETRLAYGGPRLVRAACWRLGRRPSTPRRLDREVRRALDYGRPGLMIVTGVNPLGGEVVGDARAAGVKVVNYLTDDPWNSAHQSERFLRTLSRYDAVFTPRLANMDDLRAVGVRRVDYLPFAYDPRHAAPSTSPIDPIDVLFVGGADADRVELIAPLLRSKLAVALYGDYWSDHTPTRSADRGHAPPGMIAKATTVAKVCLILVRRANRDGHVMRSFEAAACGGCLLVEDTAEHRDIFADTVTYFRTQDEMVNQARALLADPDRRRASADSSYRRVVTDGANTYADRLRTILEATATS